jgi:hypothetical protein
MKVFCRDYTSMGTARPTYHDATVYTEEFAQKSKISDCSLAIAPRSIATRHGTGFQPLF